MTYARPHLHSPNNGGHRGAVAMLGYMDVSTAPQHIPPEMPQYGEENHIFKMMQVTRAASPCRDTGRWLGKLCRGTRLRGGHPAAGRHVCGVRLLYRHDPEDPSD